MFHVYIHMFQCSLSCLKICWMFFVFCAWCLKNLNWLRQLWTLPSCSNFQWRKVELNNYYVINYFIQMWCVLRRLSNRIRKISGRMSTGVQKPPFLTSIGNSDSLANQGPVRSMQTQPPLDVHQLSQSAGSWLSELDSLSFFVEHCDSWPQGDSFGKRDHAVCSPVCSPHCKVKVLVAQSCLTLCSPMDCSLPGSSVHEILQARILEWVAIPFSRGSSQSSQSLTQGSKLGLPHCRQILFHLSHQGSSLNSVK